MAPLEFIRAAGDIPSACMLWEIYTNTLRIRKEEFACSNTEWQKILCISENQVRRCIANLRNRNLIKTELRQIDGAPTLHFWLVR